MGPHDWLGVPRIPPPARDLRVLPFFAASAVVHAALFFAVRGTDREPPVTPGAWHLPREARATESPELVAATGATEPAESEAAPGSRLALAIEDGSMRGDVEHRRDPSAAGVDLRPLVDAESWASVTGTADIEDGLTGFAAGDWSGGEMAGGFGSSFHGACCKTDMDLLGTIGTGRYGTIGHGSDTGGGYGVGPGGTPSYRTQVEARVRATDTQINCTDCDATSYKQTLKRCAPVVSYCYDKERLVSPDLGTVRFVVELVVMPGGEMNGVVVRGGGSETLRNCILDAYLRLRVRRPANEVVTVKILLRIDPT